MKRLGAILILSGPSGVGKSTVCNLVRAEMPQLEFSVSCTTRKAREGEENGRHYHFMDKLEFQRRIEEDEFIEYASVFDNLYGTLRGEVVDRAAAGHDVILDIDVQGAMQIKERCAKDSFLRRCCEFIFIVPPSLQVLEERLRGRGTENAEQLSLRLGKAEEELSHWRSYDYLLVNECAMTTSRRFISLIESLHQATIRIEEEIF